MKRQVVFYFLIFLSGLAITLGSAYTQVHIGKGWASVQGFIGAFILMAGFARLLLIFRNRK